jgi:hypothetical protein
MTRAFGSRLHASFQNVVAPAIKFANWSFVPTQIAVLRHRLIGSAATFIRLANQSQIISALVDAARHQMTANHIRCQFFCGAQKSYVSEMGRSALI